MLLLSFSHYLKNKDLTKKISPKTKQVFFFY
jgi:hypothetical protein